MRQIYFSLDEEAYEALVQRARESRMSVSAYCRRLIEYGQQEAGIAGSLERIIDLQLTMNAILNLKHVIGKDTLTREMVEQAKSVLRQRV